MIVYYFFPTQLCGNFIVLFFSMNNMNNINSCRVSPSIIKSFKVLREKKKRKEKKSLMVHTQPIKAITPADCLVNKIWVDTTIFCCT